MLPIKFLFFLSLVYSSSSTGITQLIHETVLEEVTKTAFNFSITLHEDVGLNIKQFLTKYQYPMETHWVTTEDGYMLRMHRIPRGRNVNAVNGSSRPPVLLMHGLSSNSMDWVNRGPETALGLRLADAGYDVWLGNNRGNTWSRFHRSLDADDDPEHFWDFSFEECGLYDLPAKIDYILDVTGHQQILYVGHSQGTSQFFAMAALRPEYNNKIALMAALAPVAYMEYFSSPLLRIIADFMIPLQVLLEKILKIHELLPHSWLLTEVGKLMCSDGSPFQEACASLLFIIVGFDSAQLNRNFIPVLLSNTPSGFSVKMLLHYGQLIKSGQFRRYDYGLENIKRYKSLTPPAMNVSAITAPVLLYYSENDLLTSVSDVERLAGELPNVERRKINYTLFNHLDYLVANDLNALVNDDLLYNFDTVVEVRTTPGVPTTPNVTTIETSTTGPHTSYANCRSYSTLLIVITVFTRYVIE